MYNDGYVSSTSYETQCNNVKIVEVVDPIKQEVRLIYEFVQDYFQPVIGQVIEISDNFDYLYKVIGLKTYVDFYDEATFIYVYVQKINKKRNERQKYSTRLTVEPILSDIIENRFIREKPDNNQLKKRRL